MLPNGTMLAGRWPGRLLALALIITCAAFGWIGWAAHDSQDAASTTFERALEAARLRSAIVRLDETLRAYAEMGAATGDPQWEQRYEEHEPELATAIKDAVALAPNARHAGEADEPQARHAALTEIERRALELVRQGRLHHARASLDDEEYEKQRQAFTQTISALVDSLRHAARPESQAQSGLSLPQALVFGIGGALVGWCITLGLLWRWQADDRRRHQRHTRECEQLTQRITELTNEIHERKKAEQRADEALKKRDENARELESQSRELKVAAEQAALTEQEAVGANRAKSEFLGKISHDIRASLTTMLGFTNTLLEMGDLAQAPQDRVEAIYTIRQKGEQLLDTLNDIIELCEIELDELHAEQTRCALIPIVDEVREIMAVWARARGLYLVVEYDGAVPETIETDPAILRQILVNLLGNAIKFTLRGDVRLIVRFAQNDRGNPTMQFDVIDSGVGMRKDQVGRLFQAFVRADVAPDLQSRGTGLGLAISKCHAERLGGDLVILDTLPGIGTRVRLTVESGTLDGVPMLEVPETSAEADDRPAASETPSPAATSQTPRRPAPTETIRAQTTHEPADTHA